jgi:hypothetical protein
MFGLNLALKLPLSFEVAKLQADLDRAQAFEFREHPMYYSEGWKAINLVYGGGAIHYNHKGARGYGEGAPSATAVLEQCPYFREVLGRLPGKVLMARLNALQPGGVILTHYDGQESIDMGLWRIHIPITTNPGVRFHLGYMRRRWKNGEAWVGDFTFPHSVSNRSKHVRVHLVVDIEPNAEMMSWLPRGHMSAAAKARRKKFRALMKRIAWYQYRLRGRDLHGRKDVAGSNQGTVTEALKKEQT